MGPDATLETLELLPMLLERSWELARERRWVVEVGLREHGVSVWCVCTWDASLEPRAF